MGQLISWRIDYQMASANLAAVPAPWRPIEAPAAVELAEAGVRIRLKPNPPWGRMDLGPTAETAAL